MSNEHDSGQNNKIPGSYEIYIRSDWCNFVNNLSGLWGWLLRYNFYNYTFTIYDGNGYMYLTIADVVSAPSHSVLYFAKSKLS